MSEPVWKQRLRAYVDNDGRGMKAISLAAGQGETFVRDILQRERIPSIENLIALADALGTSVPELMAEDEPDQADRSVPVMGYIGAGAEIMPEFEQVPPEGLDTIDLPFAVPDEIIAFRVKGDSMLPVYRDGDAILVWKDQRAPTEAYVGQDAAAVRTHDGRRYLKEIQRSGRRGMFNLYSHNARLIESVKVAWVGEVYITVKASQLKQIAARARAKSHRKDAERKKTTRGMTELPLRSAKG
ncbi:MAG: XRE family transcriptional regulator, partial [Variibacter sp.]